MNDKQEPNSSTRWPKLVSDALRHDLNNVIGLLRARVLVELPDTVPATPITEAFDYAYSKMDSLIDSFAATVITNTSHAAPISLTAVMDLVSQNLNPVTTWHVLKTEVPEKLPLVHADETLLAAVLTNVVDNAYAASRGSAVPPMVRIHPITESMVAIDVTDHGPGINPIVLPQLFKAPIRNSDEHNETGSGTGLFIARQLIRVWGGLIEVLDSSPSGTTIRVALRTTDPAAAATEVSEPAASTRPTSSSASPDSRPAALVVDDEPQWISLIAEVLSGSGFDVDSAHSPADAIRLAHMRRYQLALIDVFLEASGSPERSGLKVAETVRESSPDAVIIILTGVPGAALAETFRNIQVDDLLVKRDISLDTLRLRAAQAIARHQTAGIPLNVAYLDTVVNESLSIIAHELRTPLVSIKRQSEALLSGALGTVSKGQQKAIKSIATGARTALSLITGHLGLNQLDRRSEGPAHVSYDLTEILREATEGHKGVAAEKNIQLELHTPSGGYTAQIDPSVLYLALNPLIENAIKFSPAGETVSVRLTVSPNDIKIEVADNGPGMLPTDVQRVMQPRADSRLSPSPRARGSGLGLLIARRVAEFYGGHIEIDTSRSGGVKVILWLRQTGQTFG